MLEGYKLRAGGLMRCCLASLDEHMATVTKPPAEAEVFACRHCGNKMVFSNGAWEWKR